MGDSGGVMGCPPCVCPPPTSQLKDLKRQLQLERRRADRLQERLQELLTPTRIRSGQMGGGDEGGRKPPPRGAHSLEIEVLRCLCPPHPHCFSL